MQLGRRFFKPGFQSQVSQRSELNNLSEDSLAWHPRLRTGRAVGMMCMALSPNSPCARIPVAHADAVPVPVNRWPALAQVLTCFGRASRLWQMGCELYPKQIQAFICRSCDLRQSRSDFDADLPNPAA